MGESRIIFKQFSLWEHSFKINLPLDIKLDICYFTQKID